MTESRFLNYGSYLKKRYGKPAFRVGIDAGFSCPNRRGGRSGDGCSYCDGFGARAMYVRAEGTDGAPVGNDLKEDIREQTEKAVRFLEKRYNAEIFLLYLQAFSGTFAPVDRLREIYDYCLSLTDYRELIVSTRPDCIDRKKAELLASYRDRGLDVWVELGLQTADNEVLKSVNRGHTVEDFLEAERLLRGYGIKTAVHLIFGLPGDTEEGIMRTCRMVAGLRPDGLKIHNLHIPYGTPMYEQFLKGGIDVPDEHTHLERVIAALEVMPPETVIMRLTCDTPADKRAAPSCFMKKTEFYSLVREELERRKTFQGRLFRDNLV